MATIHRRFRVTIFVDVHNKVHCAPEQLHVRHLDEVVFFCNYGDHEVHFNKNGSPFSVESVSGRQGHETIVVKVDKNPGASPAQPLSFSYLSRIHGVGEVDPEIIVDPYP